MESVAFYHHASFVFVSCLCNHHSCIIRSTTRTCVPDFISDNVRRQRTNHELVKNKILFKNNAISHYVVYISNKRVDAQTNVV